MKRGIVDCLTCGTETEVESEAQLRLCDDCETGTHRMTDMLMDGYCPLCLTDDVFVVPDAARHTHNFMCGSCGGFYPVRPEITDRELPSAGTYNEDPQMVMRSLANDTDDQHLEDTLRLALSML